MSVKSLLTGQGINLLIQLLIPPVFIGAYGVNEYGDWLVLSALVASLAFLDFGLQTYVINELIVLYHRADWDKFHRLQSTALRMVLAITLASSLFLLGVFFLPVLNFQTLRISQLDASLLIYFLAIQILFSIVFAQINGSFRAIGKSYQAIMWANVQKFLYLVVTITLALIATPFWIIAFGQAITFALCIVGVLIGLKRAEPIAMPTLRYWDALLAKSSIKPSAFFGLFVVNHFLIFQAPIIVLNYFLGAQVVVIFTIARTLFSFVRQVITLTQAAAAPEITRLMGLGEKNKLARFYLLAESITLPAILILNLVVFAVSPSLIYMWVHRLDVFSVEVFLLVMIASSLMSVKEFKLYFQYATNNHAKTGIACLLAYTVMLLLSMLTVQPFGMIGFLGLWVLTELTLIFVIFSFNERLLDATSSISIIPSVKFILIIMITGILFLLSQPAIPLEQFLSQWLSALVVSILFFMISYYLFDLKSILQELRNQVMYSQKV